MFTTLFTQYKLYFYGFILLLILGLVGSTYFFYANNKNKALQITQLAKESKFWQENSRQIQESHNYYVAKLEKLQKTKNKVHTVYVATVEDIENEVINITEPTVIISSGLSMFKDYSAALR